MVALHELDGTGAKGAADAYEKLADEDPDFAPAVENVAAEKVRAGDVAGAMAVYQRLIAKYPKNMTSRLALARIYASQQKYTEAIDLCREVLQRQADAMEAFRVLAESYNAIGNTPMAELIIGRGLKASKTDVDLHYLLAQIFLDRDDLPNGVAKLKEVVRMDPKRLKVRAQLAEIAQSYRDFGNAAQQYEAILKERPEVVPVQIDLAVAYKGLGRYDAAEKIYQGVLGKDGGNAEALWNVGVLYHRHLNRYDDAIASFKRFKEVAKAGDDKVGQVDGLLAEITKLKTDQAAQREREERERKKKEAVEAACAAVAAKKAPDGAAIGNDQERVEVAWQLMANAQQVIQNGDVPGGEAAVQCAFGILPDSPAAQTGACAPMRVMWTQILYQLGRVDDAMASIKEALKCDPKNPDAQLIDQQLKDLAAQQPPPDAGGQAAPPPAPQK
jgi:tetratricopeptide (TPR) repeat protein